MVNKKKRKEIEQGPPQLCFSWKSNESKQIVKKKVSIQNKVTHDAIIKCKNDPRCNFFYLIKPNNKHTYM